MPNFNINWEGVHSPPSIMKGHMKEIEIEKKFLLTQDKAKELIIGVEPIDMIDYYVPNGQPHM